MDLLSHETFDIIISEITMLGLDGLELLDYVNKHCPLCRVILITSGRDRDILAQAIMLGAFDYIEKPFTMERLASVVAEAMTHKNILPKLSLRAAEAMRVSSQSREASLDSVWALVRAVEAKDSYTRRHSEQVAHYSLHLARSMNLSDDEIESIRVASLLHDVGKIGVPDEILTNTGSLTDEEFEHIRNHPSLGAEILSNISLFSAEADFVRYHHENFDGSGYSAGLVAEEIPLLARILRIADAIDAMLMERTYKTGYTVEKMLNELRCGSGKYFDPDIVKIATLWCQNNPKLVIQPPRLVKAVS